MKTFAKNKRAFFDFELVKKYEAGLVLKGYEVKSIKTGHISLKGSFVSIQNNELFLKNATIPLYKHAGIIKNYDPIRIRKLLINKKEINFLTEKSQVGGLTLVPLSVYSKKGKVKLSFALAKGKKKYDKRDSIKEREAKRKMDRQIKSRLDS